MRKGGGGEKGPKIGEKGAWHQSIKFYPEKRCLAPGISSFLIFNS
jgi:hypothetical protein